MDILQPLPVRQDLLRQHFFFECTCPRCRPRPRPRPHPRSSHRHSTLVHQENSAKPHRANGTVTGIGNCSGYGNGNVSGNSGNGDCDTNGINGIGNFGGSNGHGNCNRGGNGSLNITGEGNRNCTCNRDGNNHTGNRSDTNRENGDSRDASGNTRSPSALAGKRSRHSRGDSGRGEEPEQLQHEELVAAGWVCPKRQCCRRGRVVRPRLSRGNADGKDDGGGGSGEDGFVAAQEEEGEGEGQGKGREEEEREGEKEEGGGGWMVGGRCDECCGVTDDEYFDRWGKVLRTRLAAADDDFAQGRSRRGRRRLADLQVSTGYRLDFE